jgi:TolB protein
VVGANPVTVFVRQADTAQAAFEVACEAPITWGGKIAHLSNPDGWYSIYVLDGSTSSLTLVDTFAVEVPVPYHVGPQLSPDGSKIAFQSFGDIWVVNTEGGGFRNLTDHGEVISSELSWSPDGAQIAYAAHENPTKICVINADGTGSETQLADGKWRPDWSPDGLRMVFEMENGNIGVVNTDGSGLEVLVHPEGGGRHPKWSPDGLRVVFQTGVGKIGAVDGDGNNPKTLLDLDGYSTRPQWSPDGSKIAFLRELPSCNSPCVLSIADGSGNLVEEVDDFKNSQGLHMVFPFGWSPDGSKLGFSVRWFVRDKLYIVNSDGTGLTAITGDSQDHIFGSWTG